MIQTSCPAQREAERAVLEHLHAAYYLWPASDNQDTDNHFLIRKLEGILLIDIESGHFEDAADQYKALALIGDTPLSDLAAHYDKRPTPALHLDLEQDLIGDLKWSIDRWLDKAHLRPITERRISELASELADYPEAIAA